MSQPLGVYSEIGKLRKVMVCAPGLAHQRLTPSNCDDLLFDDVIWVNEAKRDHFDFVNKLEERGVDVLEMRDLLTDVLDKTEARAWILDHKITADQVGISLMGEIRAWLEEQPSRQLAEYLLGGVSARDVPESLGSSLVRMFGEYLGYASFIVPPLPNALFTRDTTCWIYNGVTL